MLANFHRSTLQFAKFFFSGILIVFVNAFFSVFPVMLIFYSTICTYYNYKNITTDYCSSDKEETLILLAIGIFWLVVSLIMMKLTNYNLVKMLASEKEVFDDV